MLVFSYVGRLAADEPAIAEAETAKGLSRWSGSDFDVQQFWHEYALCEVELYMSDTVAALRRMERIWSRLHHSLLSRIHVLSTFALYLRGRCAIAAAATGQRELLAQAKHAARRIDRRRVPWSTGFADILRAGIEAVQGRRESTETFLESARIGLVVSEMHPWAAAAAYWLNRTPPGGPGAADWFEVERIRDRRRLSAMLVPGIHDPPLPAKPS
jgi:hypothetical protein